MKLSLGFSPCPNDTFIFDAMVHGKIDTEGLEFELVIDDVEALNQKAIRKELDITKLSYHAFGHLLGEYLLLDSGSALGNNCGPLLVAREYLSADQIEQASIAIPGILTTANFLLSLAFPNARNKTEILFSEIEDAVAQQRFDAGLIIHENRFTYQQNGLVKLIDCGEFWESKTQLPIPLGGIAVKADLPPTAQQAVNRIMRRSVQYAFDNPASSSDFVCQYAQAMDPLVMKQHIDLYVNHYTLELGDTGRQAVLTLFEEAGKKRIININNKKIFLN